MQFRKSEYDIKLYSLFFIADFGILMDFADFLIGRDCMDNGIGQDLKYSDLTGKIIGSAMKVHRELGPGFSEIIYKRCLIIELKKLSINYLCEEEELSIMKENL